MLIAVAVAGPAASQDKPAATGRQSAPRGTETSDGLTAKERLSEKWTDEQRVDNCKVPLDKRGTKARPDTCTNDRSR